MVMDAFLLLLFLYVFNGVLAGIGFTDTYFPWEPLHDCWRAMDWSLYLFLLTYGGLSLYLWFNRNNPQNIHAYLRAYVILVFFRCLSVYFFPFRPSDDAVPLNDPVLNTLFYPGGYSPYDLFFSGHAATLFLFGFFSVDRKWKWLFHGMALLAGALLIAQKVHYTLDVVSAPAFAWVIAYLTKKSLDMR